MCAGAKLTIDRDALAANYRLLRRQVAPAQLAGVVKADGYGLGADGVAQTLLSQGCEHLFVALLREAVALLPKVRGRAQVYVLNGLLPGQEEVCAREGAIPVLNSLDQARRWAAEALRLDRRLPAILQVDTGMSRMGMEPWEVDGFLADPAMAAWIDLRFLISHLACADEPDHPANEEQAARFRAMAERFPDLPRALDNSGGAFLARGHFDLVRAGIALYGGAPRVGANPMRPVVSLETAIAQLRTVPAGAGVGYGMTFHTARTTRIAAIPVGYADGWPRALSNRGAAWIAGHRAPIIGRVSMDSITIDVTDVPDEHLYPGAPVELLGPHQTIDDVAADAGTISYEILTQLSRRYERAHVGMAATALNESPSS